MSPKTKFGKNQKIIFAFDGGFDQLVEEKIMGFKGKQAINCFLHNPFPNRGGQRNKETSGLDSDSSIINYRVQKIQMLSWQKQCFNILVFSVLLQLLPQN